MARSTTVEEDHQLQLIETDHPARAKFLALVRKIKGADGNATYSGNQPEWGTGRNRRTVWTIATQPYPEAHFATYPEALVEPCIKAGCPEGGTVLDPFSGSGTTGAVAVRLGRKYVGIELNPGYIEMSMWRIGMAARPNTFRDERATNAPLFAGVNGPSYAEGGK